MRKKNYKGRCEKQTLEKFVTICKTYDPIQTAYANALTEQLKAENQMEWVALMNNIRSRATEIINQDIIYC